MKRTHSGFRECKLNIGAVLAAFYIGTGGGDISKVMGMLGVGGALSFERNFSQYSPNISTIIRKVCDEFIYEALVDETIATIRQKHGHIQDETISKETKRSLNQKRFEELPKNLPDVAISVYSDMEWQKRNVGRLYDSLSGHAFLNGCRMGKVILKGVM